tara:strand:- start:579 stop:1139 length:561 start_codon:yes stop_codon:yes gene_type:complete
MARLKLFLPLVAFLILAVFLYRGLALDPQELPSARIGKSIPEFTLQQLSKQMVELSRKDVVGSVSLFNVWATWCVACRFEHPYLHKLQQQGVIIYGINYKDNLVDALEWLEERGDPFLLTIADLKGSLGLDLGVYGAPETYLVDSEGIVRYRHVGAINDHIWTTVLKPRYQKLLIAESAKLSKEVM